MKHVENKNRSGVGNHKKRLKHKGEVALVIAKHTENGKWNIEKYFETEQKRSNVTVTDGENFKIRSEDNYQTC